jgi:competence protein ComEA
MEISIFGRKIFISKIPALCAIVFFILAAGVLGFFLRQIYHPLEVPVVEKDTEIVQNSETVSEDEEAQEETVPEIKVYVTGCVNKPGVVTIKKGQVIDDAIKSAGGATKDADIYNINLAYQLTENTMLRIKAKGSISANNPNKVSPGAQAPEKQPEGGIKQNSKPVQNQNSNSQRVTSINSGVDIINDSLGAVVGEDEDKTAEGSGKKLVNINKASQAELEELPNVGPSTAKAIIDYREKNGGFKQLSDIMKITGIKQKTFDKIKDFICVD